MDHSHDPVALEDGLIPSVGYKKIIHSFKRDLVG